MCDRSHLAKREQAAEAQKARLQAASEIDPKTAKVTWHWGYTLDPYGEREALPPEARQIQRLYFARSPGSDVWVEFNEQVLDDSQRVRETYQTIARLA